MGLAVGDFNGLGSNLRKRTYIYTLDIGLMLLMFNKAGLCFKKVIMYRSFSWFWIGCQMPHSGAVPSKQWWDLKPVKCSSDTRGEDEGAWNWQSVWFPIFQFNISVIFTENC